MQELAQQVEEVLRIETAEPTSQQVGVAVLEQLKGLDDVAYLRFASVYKGFEDVGDFQREVGLLDQDHRAQARSSERAGGGGWLSWWARHRRSSWPSTPTPTTPTWRPAGPWPAGPRRAARCTWWCAPTGGRAPWTPTVRAGRRWPTCGPASWPRRRRPWGIAAHHVLGATDGELDARPGLQGELVGWVRRVRPDVVLGHDPTAVFFGQDYFNHRDHRTAGWALLDALAPAASLPHYFPEAGPPHQVATALLSGTLQPDVWVDISGSVEVKAAAVECHRSQFSRGEEGWAGDVVRRRAEEEGRRAGVPYAEGFRRLRLGA